MSDNKNSAAKDLMFELPPTPNVPVLGSTKAYPVHRIFCVGRNYVAHAEEMGVAPDREAPFYFTKSPSSIQPTHTTIPYPPGTENYHFEMELVVAIGQPAFNVSVEEAPAAVFGYASGLDMTRRDLQLVAREKRRPWDLGKDVEQSAVITAITPASQVAPIGPQAITLRVDAEIKQQAKLADLIHNVPEIISHLSGYYHLVPGDLIYTGTPAGVGAVVAGQTIDGSIDGLEPIKLTIAEAE